MGMAEEGKRLWRVSFYVEVEVEAYDGEAHLIAEAACRFPGSWRPPHLAVETEGPLDGGRVTARGRMIRSEALMVKEIDRE